MATVRSVERTELVEKCDRGRAVAFERLFAFVRRLGDVNVEHAIVRPRESRRRRESSPATPRAASAARRRRWPGIALASIRAVRDAATSTLSRNSGGAYSASIHVRAKTRRMPVSRAAANRRLGVLVPRAIEIEELGNGGNSRREHLAERRDEGPVHVVGRQPRHDLDRARRCAIAQRSNRRPNRAAESDMRGCVR